MPNPLTPEELQEIEARCNAATRGPWGHGHTLLGGKDINWNTISAGDDCVDYAIAFIGPCGKDVPKYCGGQDGWSTNSDANSQFIAHSRTDIPRLIATIRAQEKRIEELRGALRQAMQMAGL